MQILAACLPVNLILMTFTPWSDPMGRALILQSSAPWVIIALAAILSRADNCAVRWPGPRSHETCHVQNFPSEIKKRPHYHLESRAQERAHCLEVLRKSDFRNGVTNWEEILDKKSCQPKLNDISRKAMAVQNPGF